jgi:hypothetical protein
MEFVPGNTDNAPTDALVFLAPCFVNMAIRETPITARFVLADLLPPLVM